MSLLGDPEALRHGGVDEAERALDALFLRQLLQASGAFQPKAGAPPIFADLIVDALADALSRADGGAGLSLLPRRGAPSPPSPGELGPYLRPPAATPAPQAGSGPAPLDHLVEGPATVTSGFGRRVDPFGEGHRHHHGVDLGAPEGSTIVAAGAGVVRAAGGRGGYGQAVEIDHGQGVTTLYAHASELLVAPGDRVEKGQAIAKVGQTGRATGPHLHFELRVKERPVDPTRALKVYLERAEERGAAQDPIGPRP